MKVARHTFVWSLMLASAILVASACYAVVAHAGAPAGPYALYVTPFCSHAVSIGYDEPPLEHWGDTVPVGVRVYRSTARFTDSLSDLEGQTLVDQNQEIPGFAPDGAFFDLNLVNGQTYYYSIFFEYTDFDDNTLWGPVRHATVVPTIVLYGGPTASAGDGRVELGWAAPESPPQGIASMRLLRSSTGFATSFRPSTGQTIVFEGPPDSMGGYEFIDKGLVNGVRYYYSLFARDASGSWSSVPGTETARPNEYGFLLDPEGTEGMTELTSGGWYGGSHSRVLSVELSEGEVFSAWLIPSDIAPGSAVSPVNERGIVLWAPAAQFDFTAVPVARSKGRIFPLFGNASFGFPKTLTYRVPPGKGGRYFVGIRRATQGTKATREWKLAWRKTSGSGSLRLKITKKKIWVHPQDRRKRILWIYGTASPESVIHGYDQYPPPPDRTFVEVQQYVKGKWKSVTWAEIGSAGKFTASVFLPPPGKGTVKWRLRLPAFGGYSGVHTSSYITK